MPKSELGQVVVTFDTTILPVLERMAKRKYSSVQGATQSYIRAATLKQLEEDTRTETQGKKESDPS